jgi:hypothetical protein
LKEELEHFPKSHGVPVLPSMDVAKKLGFQPAKTSYLPSGWKSQFAQYEIVVRDRHDTKFYAVIKRVASDRTNINGHDPRS